MALAGNKSCMLAHFTRLVISLKFGESGCWLDKRGLLPSALGGDIVKGGNLRESGGLCIIPIGGVDLGR